MSLKIHPVRLNLTQRRRGCREKNSGMEKLDDVHVRVVNGFNESSTPST